MKPISESPVVDPVFMKKTVEAAVHLGIILLLAVWCFQIIRPFLIPVLWGGIIAIAVFPIFRNFMNLMDQRIGWAAFLFTALFLFAVIVPIFMLTDTLVEGIRSVSKEFQDGVLTVPPPPEKVSAWPLIGEKLYSFWSLASTSLQEAGNKFEPQLKQAAKWLLSGVAGAGMGILQFIFSIVISGVFLANHSGGKKAVSKIIGRLAGSRGVEFMDLITAIVRSVAQGVLGIALLQSVLAGLGLLAVGVPGAGLWALIVLFLAVVQLPTLLVLGPIVVYVFSSADPVTAVVFMIWSIVVSVSDSILKPLFLGRGLKTPMLVILLGAVGGMISSGIIGLFVGSVVLALSYELFLAWLNEEPESSLNMENERA
ncbi:MAG: AI-2E family transporter [Gammaproteobacteria bacterium]